MTAPIDQNPFPFRWGVEVLRYEWVRGNDLEWRLAARVSRSEERKLRVYDPLKDTRLFLKFAAVKTTKNGIREFADQYGDLFNRYKDVERVRRPSGQYTLPQLHGASLGRWVWEAEKIRTLVRIWRAIRGRRKSELQQFIQWKDKSSVSYTLGGSFAWLATPEINKKLLGRFRSGDVLRPAMYLLQREINRRIAEDDNPGYVAIVPRLLWCPGPRVDGIPRPDHHLRIFFQPANLLAALWLQFAIAVTEEYELRICEGCGHYFHVGKGARRIHTKTCSDRCRQRLSRRLRSED